MTKIVGWVSNNLGQILFLIIFIIFLIAMFSTVIGNDKAQKICNEKGYDGGQGNPALSGTLKCWNLEQVQERMK